MVPAVTVKAAAVEPAATKADAGVVIAPLLSLSESVVPPAGAAELSVAVQVLLAPDVKLVGLQVREERMTAAALRLRVAV